MLSNRPALNFPKIDGSQRLEKDDSCNFPELNASLAPFASQSSFSKGRLIAEEECSVRSSYARDRDRIVHSTAFRRLNYKTQVFIYHEGDHYRSRLTHSLEVAQIARSLANILKVDENLCEAISLAHDIGHTPFGHAGERALNRALSGFGGFDHNLHSLRLLTNLEKRYASFDGLNLTWETLEGLLKHNGPVIDTNGDVIGSYRERAPADLLRWYEVRYGFGLHQYAGPEAQIAAIADDIAYNNHDIDDGVRAGLIEFNDLEQVPLVREIVAEIKLEHRNIDDTRLKFELNRRLITRMIKDVVVESQHRLDQLAPSCADDIRAAKQPVISFSGDFLNHLEELRQFLYRNVYRHDRIMNVMNDAEKIIEDLVGHYMNRPDDLPPDWRCNDIRINIASCAERIRDFIAGMTDRYIIDLHRSLFDVTPKLR